MAFENNVMSFNLGEADGALSQYTLVRHDGTDVVQSGAGIEGYSLQEPTLAAGDIAAVMLLGITKLTLGATVARGVAVMSDAAGLAITLTATNECVGRVLEGGVVNDVVAMIANPAQGAVA